MKLEIEFDKVAADEEMNKIFYEKYIGLPDTEAAQEQLKRDFIGVVKDHISLHLCED